VLHEHNGIEWDFCEDIARCDSEHCVGLWSECKGEPDEEHSPYWRQSLE
jgi:hypothetical protein